MCQDAPLSQVHVFDPLDLLPPNWIVNKKIVPLLVNLFAQSLGDLLGLDQHYLAKCPSFL